MSLCYGFLVFVLFCFASSFVWIPDILYIIMLLVSSFWTNHAGQHEWTRLRKNRMATGRKKCSEQIDTLSGGWSPHLLQFKQVKPNCLKPRGTRTPMFRGTWIVVSWSSKGYWTQWKSGHNVYGLYRSLFSKRKEKRIKRNVVCTFILYIPIYLLFL